MDRRKRDRRHEVIEKAQLCISPSEFQLEYPSEYVWARNNKILKECYTHMHINPNHAGPMPVSVLWGEQTYDTIKAAAAAMGLAASGLSARLRKGRVEYLGKPLKRLSKQQSRRDHHG